MEYGGHEGAWKPGSRSSCLCNGEGPSQRVMGPRLPLKKMENHKEVLLDTHNHDETKSKKSWQRCGQLLGGV